MSVARGIAAGVGASALVALLVGATSAQPRAALVPEDASGHLQKIAIHYTPAMDEQAMPVWKQLFRVLPAEVEVEVAVPTQRDFDRFVREVGAARRFRPIVVGHPITTWSRDRMAALSDGRVLSPPRVATPSGERAGDWDVPFAIAKARGDRPRLTDIVFEGGDLAATKHTIFADVNLVTHNLGRGDATPEHLRESLQRTFAQDLVWLGDAVGDVPEHHIMMYMMPLDDTHALVGDVRLGIGSKAPHDPGHEAQFDRVARELEAHGMTVTRVPVVVLPGAGSYVTYTNAVFDEVDGHRVVYLPTYREPVLDAQATAIYERLGYRVIPIDVSTIYTLNGSLGCLVNVLARGGT